MANNLLKNEKRDYEELSDKTLELMLFREMLLNSDFLGKLCSVVDYRWFRTVHIQKMAKIVAQYYLKTGLLVTKDIMESMLQRINEHQQIESNKLDIAKFILDFNKATQLDLGGMSDETRLSKIQNYVRREALRCAMLEAAEKIDGRPGDSEDSVREDGLWR